jgi:DNA-binding CsgD family transcriptional regulator
VTVAYLDAQVQSPVEELRLVFGLTAAEARIAGAIFEGMSLPEAAQAFGLSGHTVRFQLARVFDKTGVARQTELVKLMTRLETAQRRRANLS